MHKLIVLTIALTMVYCSVFSEEVQQEAEKSKVLLAFEALPYQPSDKQIEEFYATLKAECRLRPPSLDTYGQNALRIIPEVFSLGDTSPLLVPNPELFRDRYPVKRDAVSALRKCYAFGLCLIKLAMEGTDIDLNHQVRQIMRDTTAMLIESIYTMTSCDAGMKDGRIMHRKWFKDNADSLNSKYGYRDRIYRQIEVIKSYFNFSGKDKWEQLNDWRRKYDSSQLEHLEAEAYLDWLFCNFSLSDITISDLPHAISIAGESMRSLLEKYIKSDYIDSANVQWKSDGKRVSSRSLSHNALIKHAVLLLLPKICADTTSMSKASLASIACSLDTGTSRYGCLSSQTVKRLYDSALSLLQSPSYDINYKMAQPMYRFKTIGTGSCGPAWFLSDTDICSKVGRLSVNDCFMYPSVYLVAESLTGFDSLCGISKDKHFINFILDSTGYFQWHPFTHFQYETPTPTTISRVNCDIEYDVSFGGRLFMMQGEMGRSFLKGTSISYNSYQFFAKDTASQPGLFHFYTRTKFTLYTLWDYNYMFDYCYYERPICMLVVHPDEEFYERSIVGLHDIRFNTQWHKCGGNYLMNRIWTADIFANDPINAEIFDKAKQITRELDDAKGERWNKAMEEKKKYEEEHKYEVYW